MSNHYLIDYQDRPVLAAEDIIGGSWVTIFSGAARVGVMEGAAGAAVCFIAKGEDVRPHTLVRGNIIVHKYSQVSRDWASAEIKTVFDD